MSGSTPTTTPGSPRHGKTVLRLSLLVVGMFGFGWALIPMYDLLCEITGLGGRTGDQYVYDPATMKTDTSRLVEVNFITNANAGMPWQFWAEKGGVRVHPGELKEVKFYVRNTTNRRMIGQAIPSVVPNSAAAHFHKTECFCFNQQTLASGEALDMPLQFIVDQALPATIKTITLSYTLFDVSGKAADNRVSATN